MSDTITANPLTRELDLPLAEQVVAVRRDLHRFAEPGWCEIRTASKVYAILTQLGWDVSAGRDVIAETARMGVPDEATLARSHEEAVAHGADPDVARLFAGGFTGVVGRLRRGSGGPVIAFRFDMDANFGRESSNETHVPAREGFASIVPGVHHNCGHDGHTSMGLGLARALSDPTEPWHGEVRLVFQPAEEGLRGARAMVEANVLDGVEWLIGCHVGVRALEDGIIIPGYTNILASHKFDAHFVGRSAHAALSPQVGRNALLAACEAVQGLLALSRHSEGETRVNVGSMVAGDARNAIPAHASICAEVRAETTEILEYLMRRSDEVVHGAALMQDVGVETEVVGGSCAASSDEAVIALVREVAPSLPGVTRVADVADYKACDDAAEMMAAVQRYGGKAGYFGLGTALKDVHHAPLFDFDDRVLPTGVAIMAAIVHRLAGRRA